MITQKRILLVLGVILSVSLTANAQKLDVLKNYSSIYYELEFDDNGNEVINTACGEPTVSLRFICPEESDNCHFTYEESIFHITNLTKGNSDEEFILKYKNDFDEIETAIFYYDRVVNQLLLTFDGMNLAFVAKEDLDKFTVKDKCDQ